MAKRIIVCSDGTGNTSIKGRGTNVFKLFEAIDLNGHRFDPKLTPQIALYDDGVGTENFKPLKIFAGATGFGLGRNVRQLYKEIVRIYDPGDQIYVFGFSRGAFTVRTLVGLIATCGIVDRNKLEEKTARALQSAVKRAYSVYRHCFRTWLAQRFLGRPTKEKSDTFRRQYALDTEVRIRFVGVWDTVDAVGLPFHLSDILNTTLYRFKFPDHCLSPIVDRACHALAIDDERHSFSPLLWDERDEKDEKDEKKNRIEQIWFAGAHSNVGGGYPKQGMSLVALDWMLAQAERAGLRFDEVGLRLNQDERRLYRDHANVDDKLYEPRAGLGMFYRWKIRDIAQLCTDNGVTPKLHLSVLERAAHGTEDYAPGNLPTDAEVVFTPDESAHVEMLRQRAQNVQEVLRAAQNGKTLLASVKGAVLIGRVSYYVYLISCIAVLAAAAGAMTVTALLNPSVLFKSLGSLIGGFLMSPARTVIQIVQQLWDAPALVAWLAGGFALAYVLSLIADSTMSTRFSQFWHHQQQKLREALKQARQEVAQASAKKPAA